MSVTWNDSDRCAEFLVEELDVCLFGVQDIMIDCTFRCWGMTPSHIEVQLGAKGLPLDHNDPVQGYIHTLAIAELLQSPRYAELREEADDLIDAADQKRYPRDVGYGHMQHELI